MARRSISLFAFTLVACAQPSSPSSAPASAPPNDDAPITSAVGSAPRILAPTAPSCTIWRNFQCFMRTPIIGGAPITIASNQFYPDAIALDADNVYFTIGEGGGGSVMKAQKGGGTPVALATAQAYPTSVAVNSTHVFSVNFGTGTINSVAK